MNRERALKVVLVIVGLLFCAGIVPLTMFFSREPSVPMLMSIYVTLGIFLLLAVRDPAAKPQPDRLRGMGKSCSSCCHGGAGIPQRDRAPRTRGSGFVRSRRDCAGRIDSHEAHSRESFYCRGVRPAVLGFGYDQSRKCSGLLVLRPR